MTRALVVLGKNINSAAMERSIGMIFFAQGKTGDLIYRYEAEIFILLIELRKFYS
jgi:hypothetical protein